MIQSALFLLMIQAPWTPVEQIYRELSHQLSFGRFNTVVDEQGRLTECEVTKSTGDTELDDTFCEGVRACLTPGHRDMGATAACMDKKQEELLRDLAAKRAALKTTS